MRSLAEELLPRLLGSPSEAYLGSPHKPHQNPECLQTGSPHRIPFFRGSTCSLGEKFSECLADKIDQMQARSPAAKICRLHVEASPAESSQHSHTSLRPASQGPQGYLLKSPAFRRCRHQRPSRENQSQRGLSGPLRETIPLNVILKNKFAGSLKLETCPVLERQSPRAQLSSRRWLALSTLPPETGGSLAWLVLVQRVQGRVPAGIQYRGQSLGSVSSIEEANFF